MKYAILAVLCLAGTVFGAVSYDGTSRTLTYGAASDLDSAVDPLGQGLDLTDPATMYGNLTKDGFNGLSGLQVIGFNAELTPSQFNLTSTINAAYDATHTLTFTDFGDPGGYNYGGGNSQGRQQFSGANTWDQLGTVGGGGTGTPVGTFHTTILGLNWFATDISVTQANAGVSAIGFLVCGRSSSGNYTDTGNIYVTLSDTSVVSYPYGIFGGGAPNPPGIGFFYQAPAGLFVTRVECTRDEKAGNSYVALDDLGFVIGSNVVQPHPGDANNDGTVDVVDLGILAKNYGNQPPPATFAQGDFNGDGAVDVTDLGILAKNYGWTGTPAGAVPEPMTLSLLVVGGAAMLRRKR